MKLLRILWLLCPLACAGTGAPHVVPPVEAPSARPAPAVTTAAVEGQVESSAKTPVAGAVVALIPAREDWDPGLAPPAGRMLTGPDGRFRFEGLAPGEYGLTVSAAGHEAAFLMGVKLAAGATPHLKDVVLQPARHIVRGRVKTDSGEPVPGVWLNVGRYSDFLGDMLYARTDAQGRFEVPLPVAGYGVSVHAEGFSPARRTFNVTAEESTTELDLTVSALPETTPPAPEVVSWVKQSLAPLTTVEAGHGFEDLRPLKPWLSKARVVALGEATHGSREFFQLKHRMLEYLATELGFTVFAIEASFGESLVVNDYVLHGKGDPAKALAGLYFWTWDTEEVLALIRWMRAYNEDPRHTRKLQFYGVDMQATSASTRAVLDFFARADPSFHQRLVGPMTPFLDEANPRVREVESGKVLAGLVADIEARLAKLPKRKGTEKTHALVARHARILGQFAARVENQFTDSNLRDRAMAENARWILEHEGADARMVLWAHNAHVAASPQLDMEPMGKHLREALGDQLYVFGFAFNQGEFQAIHSPSEPNEARRGLSVHAVPAAEVGWLDGTLALAEVPRFALDLRGLPGEGVVRDYFMQARYTRNYGAVFSKVIPPRVSKAAKEYDGLLFVERTVAAIATPTGRRPPPPPTAASAP
ncbi:erythromycin esterase [Myxococcus stipitatus DSM 14675]|uniref:Erythromycin esterase n=1 Tax=Myxococcus stipitatus (strain DSM 14675 / JCM 12634 / Mx s8) TaxID=1278073 RepID=L7U4M5_MYXSD|nr:erythromycin esterase family protein [Myxococcus stipitatus]AGC43113.1 erythromycin esterase [Myxococcus stipitatus DSM 14675]